MSFIKKTEFVRPYQLMCMICKLGSCGAGVRKGDRLNGLLKRVKAEPAVPLNLCCNVEGAYRYQNPGHSKDTPGGTLFNAKRDLDILQRLGVVPGATYPAFDILQRLFERIPKTLGICGYTKVTAKIWKGCDRARSGDYERGLKIGMRILLKSRTVKDAAKAKKESAQAMYMADVLRLRPHHLLCMACFYGGHKKLAPVIEDNLFEALDRIRKHPEVPITLIAGCCMICPPCPYYLPKMNQCIGPAGMELRDQKKDLDVLQRLGLCFGDTLPAKRLFRLLFERISSTEEICGYGDGVERSVEWGICSGAKRSEDYNRARQDRIGLLKGE